MESMMLEKIVEKDELPNIKTESFFYEGVLYNASYVPTDDAETSIMLERVTKFPEENIYFKNRMYMIVINVINSSNIKVAFPVSDTKEAYELSYAAATAAYQFDLVKNYLTVDLEGTSLPIHIHLSNR
jgi:hypothetical protein